MNISRTQTDKLLVGSNDVSYEAPDKSPTGTAVLNGPVYIGKPTASPEYEGILNVASNGALQNSLDQQPAYKSDLAIKVDGNVKIKGDDKTPNALDISGNVRHVGDTHHTGNKTHNGNLITSNLIGCSGQGCSWSGSTINSQGWKGFDIDLIKSQLDADKKFDAKSGIIIYEAFKNLTPIAASNKLLWATLTHKEFKKYTIKRWPLKKDEKDRGLINSHFFFDKDDRRAYRRNAISRLWWGTFLTVSPWEKDTNLSFLKSDDEYKFTKIMLGSQQLGLIFKRGDGDVTLYIELVF